MFAFNKYTRNTLNYSNRFMLWIYHTKYERLALHNSQIWLNLMSL